MRRMIEWEWFMKMMSGNLFFNEGVYFICIFLLVLFFKKVLGENVGRKVEKLDLYVVYDGDYLLVFCYW